MSRLLIAVHGRARVTAHAGQALPVTAVLLCSLGEHLHIEWSAVLV